MLLNRSCSNFYTDATCSNVFGSWIKKSASVVAPFTVCTPKQTGWIILNSFLENFRRKWKDFCRHFVTVDEKWTHPKDRSVVNNRGKLITNTLNNLLPFLCTINYVYSSFLYSLPKTPTLVLGYVTNNKLRCFSL